MRGVSGDNRWVAKFNDGVCRVEVAVVARNSCLLQKNKFCTQTTQNYFWHKNIRTYFYRTLNSRNSPHVFDIRTKEHIFIAHRIHKIHRIVKYFCTRTTQNYFWHKNIRTYFYRTQNPQNSQNYSVFKYGLQWLCPYVLLSKKLCSHSMNKLIFCEFCGFCVR